MSRKHVPLTETQWQTFWRLVRYAFPYWIRFSLAIFFGVVIGGSIVGMLASIRGSFVEVFGSGSGIGVADKAEVWVEQLYQGDMNHSWLVILVVLGMLLLFVAARGIGFFFSKYLIEWIAQRITMRLRNETFESILHLPMSQLTSTRTGELISRTISDTQLVERGLADVASDIIQQPFILLGAISYILVVNFRLALVTMLVFPLCILPVRIFGRRVRRNAMKGQEHIADLASIQQETILGAAIVKSFGTEKREFVRFSKHSLDFFTRQIKIVAARAAINPMMEFISAVAASAVLLYAKYSGLSFDSMFAFLGAMVLMYAPAKALSRVHLSIQQCVAAADRVFQIIDTADPIQDLPGAAPLDTISTVEYKDVAFSYNRSTPVLQGINLSAKRGMLVALVGSSGSGKTTLVNLLPRFYDPTGGTVLLNGEPITHWSIETLRRNIGLVTQETVLFNDTVRNNIAYGNPAATFEDIQAAAKKAHAHDFIMAMENGYDTLIAERGILLSGGQRQRLAIARALLRNPSVLILDEATSALDTESERAVQAALDEAIEGRTVFAIAHRLSTIIRADQILVLDGGRIIERGTHAELIGNSAAYHRLYQMQFNHGQNESA